ncbi:MAG: hypothetical protein ACI80M_000949 [Gammaproteobacteria bacterium]|jgi:hypothetical protein
MQRLSGLAIAVCIDLGGGGKTIVGVALIAIAAEAEAVVFAALIIEICST